MLRVPSDIRTILCLKCALVAQYNLPTNALTTQACVITIKTPKYKLSITDRSNTTTYNTTYKYKYSRVPIMQHKQKWYVVGLPKTSNNAKQITN